MGTCLCHHCLVQARSYYLKWDETQPAVLPISMQARPGPHLHTGICDVSLRNKPAPGGAPTHNHIMNQVLYPLNHQPAHPTSPTHMHAHTYAHGLVKHISLCTYSLCQVFAVSGWVASSYIFSKHCWKV